MFKELPLAHTFKADMKIAVCSKCGLFHPFFLGKNGTIVHLINGWRKDGEVFAKANGMKAEDLKKYYIFICYCGTPIKCFESEG